MNKTVLAIALISSIIGSANTGFSASPVKMEVLFMNHGPLRPTIEQIRQVVAGYGEKVAASWYDFESREGEAFMASKGIRQHIPLMLWLDGKTVVPVDGKDVQFAGFPSGSGPMPFQGKWTMDDLRKALDALTGKK
ncbi:MAG TPA: hypothetical protein DEO88_14520 [Syntrophobacteraceae bacterium]|jgi:hypothetical protein|nr:hypothetical protein [Syntrophobacteraceae bacterium]